MLLPVLVFVGVVTLVYGAYYLLILRDEQRLLNRLQPSRAPRRVGRLDVLKPEETMSSVSTFDTALKASRFAGAIQSFLDQAGSRTSVAVFLLASAVLAALAYMVAFFFLHSAITGAIAAVTFGSMPYLVVRHKRAKRVAKFEEQFPEAISLVARALRAGHALPTGLGMVADELQAPVGTEFRILFDEQNFGLTLPDALRNFARRVPVLDARFFVTAVLTQREAGGNLAEVLDNLGEVIRTRFKIKRQVRVLSAHGRITGWALGLLPPALALVTFILNPGHLGTLTGDPLGQRMIAVAIVLQLAGMYWIRRLVDVEY
jgi:tight adherence protein B